MPNLQICIYDPKFIIGTDEDILHEQAILKGNLIDDLCINYRDQSDYPREIRVAFSGKMKSPSESYMLYYGSWVDPETKKRDPSLLQAYFPLEDFIKSFLLRHDFKEKPLILSIGIEGNRPLISHIGPYDDGETIWDANIESKIPIKINWITQDETITQRATEPEIEVAPANWQKEAIANNLEGLMTLKSEIEELRKIFLNLKFYLASIIILLLVVAFK
jgi:hypothetical protein